jgi:cyanate lyase
MTKDEMKAVILAKKNGSGMSWEQIAAGIGMSPVWTTSACLGMNSMPEDKAGALCKLLGLPEAGAKALQACPHKH